MLGQPVIWVISLQQLSRLYFIIWVRTSGYIPLQPRVIFDRFEIVVCKLHASSKEIVWENFLYDNKYNYTSTSAPF